MFTREWRFCRLSLKRELLISVQGSSEITFLFFSVYCKIWEYVITSQTLCLREICHPSSKSNVSMEKETKRKDIEDETRSLISSD